LKKLLATYHKSPHLVPFLGIKQKLFERGDGLFGLAIMEKYLWGCDGCRYLLVIFYNNLNVHFYIEYTEYSVFTLMPLFCDADAEITSLC
jgi:hypothetical protein